MTLSSTDVQDRSVFLFSLKHVELKCLKFTPAAFDQNLASGNVIKHWTETRSTWLWN